MRGRQPASDSLGGPAGRGRMQCARAAALGAIEEQAGRAAGARGEAPAAPAGGWLPDSACPGPPKGRPEPVDQASRTSGQRLRPRQPGAQAEASGRRTPDGNLHTRPAAAEARLKVAWPEVRPRPSPRVLEVVLRFGQPAAGGVRVIADGLRLTFAPGTITLVLGPSGAGKSSLLAAVAEALPGTRSIDAECFPADVAVIDAVAPTRPVAEAMRALTACGLGEPCCWTRRFSQLSEGERFRARLARAITLHRRAGTEAPLLCDEFGARLHVRLARATAFNLRKLATRERLRLVVACSREDLAVDLQPDTVVRLGPSGVESVSARQGLAAGEPEFSLWRALRIEPGGLKDYAALGRMHYRADSAVGFVDKVFVCRESPGGEVLGAVVYGRPALELSRRNACTAGRFVRRPDLLNREVRSIKRLVVHPDVRGCGIAHRLVRATLPMVGTRFVETLAAMGEVNPVFEKAGMTRVGCTEPPASMRAALSRLARMGVDPLDADFAAQVRARPAVRQVVVEAVRAWYRATTGGLAERRCRQADGRLPQVFRQLAGSRPVYYIWARDAADWRMIRARSA